MPLFEKYAGMYIAGKAEAVTPSDVTVFVSPRRIYVGGTGDVAVMPFEGTTAVTFVAVQAGTFIPLAVKQVMSTNTDATQIVAMKA